MSKTKITPPAPRGAKHNIINRTEMQEATLQLGSITVELADYATTGLFGVIVGQRGCCKTNSGLVIAEQLSEQGWVSVIIDPESELESLYGDAVEGPEELHALLESRERKIIIVSAKTPDEFIPYGEVIKAAADEFRKPILVMIDEGQIFSSSRKRENGVGEATDIITDFGDLGRKRALDVVITSLSFTSSLSRRVFNNKNLTLIGCQEDPAVWSMLSSQFRRSNIEYADISNLVPSEFFCISRRGIDKIKMPMAKALVGKAPKARMVKKNLPRTYSQWARAMSNIPTERLDQLTNPVVQLMSSIVGLSGKEIMNGINALDDELAIRDTVECPA